MTDATTVDTLTEFLNYGHTDYYIFDLGRLVQPIAKADFAAMEAGQRPFPSPLQQQAWLGIVFWNKDRPDTPYIWFAKFPLDERGLISHAARQHYLQIIIEALGRDITANAQPKQEELLKQNPYLFTPSEDKRAAFHAQVQVLLQSAPSIYFEHAQSFLLGQSEDWQQLGVQGLHDVIARLATQPKVSQSIQQSYWQWPPAFRSALCQALEQHQLPTPLITNLTGHLQQALQQNNWDDVSHLLRALASGQQQPCVSRAVQGVLRQLPQQDIQQNLLVIMAARLWQVFTDESLRNQYLQALSQQRDLFPHLFADLVALPSLRPYLLHILSQPDAQPDSVQAAIAHMKASVRQHV